MIVFIKTFSPSQFVSMQIILTLSKQNKLFGNENKAEDHTQQFIKMKTKLPKSVYKETIETVLENSVNVV